MKRAMRSVPERLDKIQIKGQIITIDAMGTQKAIAEKIKKKRADYVLALKGNQAGLYEDVELYFRDEGIRKGLRGKGKYVSTTEKAHGQIEKRGHWSVESMHWHLDVTFREDANTTLDKQAAQNQDIIRK